MIFFAGTMKTCSSDMRAMLKPSTLLAALTFRRERDWEQFHTPQNLAIAISVEAGELLERFQWMQSGDAPLSDKGRLAIEHEMADIAILLSYLVHDLAVELDDAVLRKLALNAERYPVDKARGKATKYDEL